MNREIVERAVVALAALNGTKQDLERPLSGGSVRTDPPMPKLVDKFGTTAACGSPDCAGCYDVGNGRKIHPPKCGKDFLRWRAWLEGKGPGRPAALRPPANPRPCSNPNEKATSHGLRCDRLDGFSFFRSTS